jgi:hypothetical protein
MNFIFVAINYIHCCRHGAKLRSFNIHVSILTVFINVFIVLIFKYIHCFLCIKPSK